MEKALSELTNLTSAGVERAIEGYARWYLVSATGWMILGLAIVVTGILLGRKKVKDMDDWNEFIRYLVMAGCILLGLMIVIFNLSTICAPEAYAIHKLIMDIK